jgi:hypothetical protein
VETPFTMTPCGREHPSCDCERSGASATEDSAERTWAEIGRLVGQRKLSITVDTYTHVLSDGRELDYATLVSELVRR